MSYYSSTARFSRSLTAALLLGFLYWGYSMLTSPVLDVQRKQQVIASRSQHVPSSMEYKELAGDWFPDRTWVAEAGKHLRDKGRYLYFRSIDLSEDRHSVAVSPIALLWTDPDDPDQVPITATADSAVLRTSDPFSESSGGFGEIVGGTLDGVVTIRGPQRLQITGRKFSVSEDSLKLWSSQPVEFRWDGHSGRAASGVEIIMHTPTDGKSGLMSASDVSEIRLVGRVTCHLHFPARRRGDEDVELQISSANGFEFDVDTKIGTFLGFRNRSLDPENQVLVRRPAKSGLSDRLVCSQLTTIMRPEVDAVTGEVSNRRLHLEQVVAEGERVVFHSQEHELVAVMSELRYSVDQRQLDLRNLLRDSQDRVLPVRVTQHGSVLEVPHIRVIHNEHGDIRQISALGQGRLRHDTENRSMTASWLRELSIRQIDHQRRLVKLLGQASVAQESNRFGLSAELIEMEVHDNGNDEIPASGSRNRNPGRVELSDIQPESLKASGDVVLQSADIIGNVRDQLDVSFATLPNLKNDAIHQTSNVNGLSGLRHADHSNEEDHGPPINFVADTMQATVNVPEDASGSQQMVQLTDLWLKGNVEVHRTSNDADQNFTATGNALHAERGLRDTHELKLFGNPARATGTTMELEGQRIDLDELSNRFTVNGSGKLRLITDKGIDGKPLPRPTPLDIYWTESMTFSGRQAHFIGNIRAVLNDERTVDLELQSHGLKVYFTQDVSLNSNERSSTFHDLQVSQSRSQSVDLQSVECESRVSIRIDQLTDGEVISRHRAQLADLTVNVQNGAVHGVGPGWISSVSPTGPNRARSASPVRVASNTPTSIHQSGLMFVRASFIGELTGNLNDRFANLNHHVTGIVAPVGHLDDVLNVESLAVSELPEQCGIIRSEQLSISAIPGSQPGTETFALTARENSRVESRHFSGDADVITYDDAKQQFILRAEQDRIASVRHRPGNSSQFQTINGKRFEYYPAPRNQLIANQISGVQASE